MAYLLVPEICLEDFNVFTKGTAYSKSWVFERDCINFLEVAVKQQKSLCHSSGGQKSKIKVLSELYSFQKLERESSFLFGFWKPRYCLTCGSPTQLGLRFPPLFTRCASVFTWHSLLHVCLCPSFPHRSRTSVLNQGPWS